MEIYGNIYSMQSDIFIDFMSDMTVKNMLKKRRDVFVKIQRNGVIYWINPSISCMIESRVY